ncbi:cutinase family protein [Mycolicibacterium thermoresistibile]
MNVIERIPAERRPVIRLIGLVSALMMAGWVALLGALGATAPTAAAQPCPDVEVVFARGTDEPPGVGGVGQAFVDSLRSQIGDRSMSVYAVNYPASSNFSGGIEFARTVVDGIRDAAEHVQATAATCPDTRIVLGGYSQGAAVAGYVTAAAVPEEVPAEFRSYIPEPMPREVADHVAAVVLFSKPSAPFIQRYGAPPITIGSVYADKTLELCAEGDTICSGVVDGGPNIAHVMYAVNGMVPEGAAFAAGRL